MITVGQAATCEVTGSNPDGCLLFNNGGGMTIKQ
jgi:hypothetical protein